MTHATGISLPSIICIFDIFFAALSRKLLTELRRSSQIYYNNMYISRECVRAAAAAARLCEADENNVLFFEKYQSSRDIFDQPNRTR